MFSGRGAVVNGTLEDVTRKKNAKLTIEAIAAEEEIVRRARLLTHFLSCFTMSS
jgi:hypothetical protein